MFRRPRSFRAQAIAEPVGEETRCSGNGKLRISSSVNEGGTCAAERVGAAVTITATQKPTGKEQTQIIGVEFLVHSTLPVTFHAGYTVRALKELSFESVGSAIQTAGGADLFAKVQDSEANGTFTAFMSYRLCDIGRANR